MATFVPDEPTQGPSFVPDEAPAAKAVAQPSFVPDAPKKTPTYATVYDAGAGFTRGEFKPGDTIIVGGEEQVFKGLKGIPQIAEQTLAPSINIPRIEHAPEITVPGTGLPVDLMAAGANVVGGAAAGLTAPVGAVLVPLATGGAAGKALNTLAGSAFSGSMAAEIPDQIKEAIAVIHDPRATRAQKLEAASTPGVTAIMAGLAGAGSLHEATSIGRGVMPEVKSAVSQPDVAPVALPEKTSLITKVDSIEGGKNPKATNAAINASIMAPDQQAATMPAPPKIAQPMPSVAPEVPVESVEPVAITKGAKQRELALKAQDPETWAYLDEQRKVNGPDRMTNAEFDQAVKTALKGMEKPAENADLLPVEASKAAEAPETLAKPETPAAAKEPTAAVASSFTLPKELAGAKPKYGYGSKLFHLDFASDLDKAGFIIAQTKKSKSDAKYLQLVMDHLGVDEADARAYGAAVRDRIKAMARKGKSGEVLTIPDTDAVAQGKAATVSDPLVQSVAKMNHDQFADFARNAKGGFTTAAIDLGQKLGPDAADHLLAEANKVRKDFEKAMKDGEMQKAINLSNKAQFFSEAAQSAKGTLSHLEDVSKTASEKPLPPENDLAKSANEKPNAVQIESAGKVDVQPAPRDGQALGAAHQVDQGLAEPRQPTGEVPGKGEPFKEGDVRNGPPLEPPSDLSTGENEPPLDPQSYQYRPGLTAMPIVGDAFKVIKKVIGIVYDNVYAANHRLGGVLKEYEFGKTTQGKWFEDMSIPLSRLARQAFTKHGIDVFGRMLMNGDIKGAEALANTHTRIGPEIGVAIDHVMRANDKAFELQQLSRGEENVTRRENYFARKIRNYDKLMEFLNERERGVADKALESAQKANGDKPLSREEQEIVLNNLIRDSAINKSKPGYLKPRTIEEIDAKISQFYEPFDVAMEDHYRKVTNDYYDRLYFGKQKESYARGEGKFGETMAAEIAAGRLSPKAQAIVADNLRARFALQKYGDGTAVKFAEKMRLAQTGAYLGQLAVSASQFMDILSSAFHTTWKDTVKGYVKRNFSLRDIGVHEGNVETTRYSANKTKVDEAIRLIVKVGTGLSDQFNKGGMANAFAYHLSDIIRQGSGREYSLLQKKYEELYPARWKAMFKAIADRDYEKGNKMSPDAKLFIFSELSDMHPLNPSGMAQGYNAASAWVKPMYGLKSYWLKQVGLLRSRGYEMLKNPDTRARGITYLAAYSTMVAAGQNVIMQYIRDKMAGRKTDVHEALVGGYLQMAGLSRYNIGQVADGHIGDALLGFALPAAGLLKEGLHDTALTRDALIRRQDKSGRPLVRNVSDYLKQAQLVRHAPLVGTILYQRYGAGKTLEDKRNAELARGKKPLGTLDEIGAWFNPGRKTTDRK